MPSDSFFFSFPTWTPRAGDLAVNVLPNGAGDVPVRLLRERTLSNGATEWLVRVVGGRGQYSCPIENLRPAI